MSTPLYGVGPSIEERENKLKGHGALITEKVTWLLPVKNGMPYLPETLASIEAQTYKNWEILAWDNDSTDGTLEELQRWIPSRLPGRVVSDRPMALGASLGALVNEATTKLCARIDADDVNLPDRLEKQVGFLRAHPEIAMVGGQITKLDAQSREHAFDFLVPTDHDEIVHFLIAGWGFWHPTVMFRRSNVLAAGNYQDVSPVEDVDLWWRMANHFRLANLPDVVLKYRVHDRSSTVQNSKDDTLIRLTNARYEIRCHDLYGITPAEARSLASEQFRGGLPIFVKIAKHLCRSHGGNVFSRMQSPWFRWSMRRKVSRADTLTRLAIRILSPDRRTLFATVVGKMKGKWLKALNTRAPKITL